MRTMRHLALLLAPLALAAPAQAATWSAPETLSQRPHTFVGPLRVASGAEGQDVVAWPWQDGIGRSATVGAGATMSDARVPTFDAESPAPTGLVDVGVFGDGGAVALSETVAGGAGRSGAQRLRLRLAPMFGAQGASRTVAVAPIVHPPALSVAGRHLAVAWIEETRTAAGATRRIVRVYERLSATRTRPAGTVSGTGRADAVAVAAGADGTTVVVLARDGRLLARIRRAGHGWGAFAELARARPGSATRFAPQAAVDEQGRVRVVWRRHRFRTEAIPGVRSLEGSFVAAGQRRFRPAQTLEADGVAAFVLRSGSPGWAVGLVRQTTAGPQPVVRRAGPATPFGAPLAAAPAQGGLRGVDVTDDGAGGLTVAWVQPVAGQDGDGQAHAAVLAPGAAAFGPVEDVSPAEAVHEVRLVGAGVDAVWSARPEGTGPGIPIGQVRSVVRSARRAP
jgi:hypothetical protein